MFRRTALPAGTYRLKNGHVLLVGPGGLVKVGSAAGGAGSGKVIEPVHWRKALCDAFGTGA